VAYEEVTMDDWAGICVLLARYVAVIDNARFDELPALFSPTGSLRSRITGRATPRQELSDYLRAVISTRTRPAWKAIHHHLAMPSISMGQDGIVRSTCYFTAFNADAPDHWGAYRDTLVKTGGSWVFEERSVEMTGSEPTGWVGSGAAALR
jgi:hypothetical protein